jgi:hypothetical protein
MSIFSHNQKGRYCPKHSISQVTKLKMFFDMDKITKLNPTCKTSRVKNHVIYSLSENKKINLTAMP